MEQIKMVMSGSLLCRGLTALYLWCAAGWQGSGIVRLCALAAAAVGRTVRGCAAWIRRLVEGSVIWRLAMALCDWCGRQWRASGIIQWFLHPRGWSPALSEGSLFFRLWEGLRSGLCRLYDRLGLERLFGGSVFGYPWFWCMLPVVLAPLIPTMGVLALTAAGCCSLLLSLVRDRARQLAWSPVNRYIILYAVICLIGALGSVDVKSSLEPGLLTTVFILFAVVLFNGITDRKQLDHTVTLLLWAAAAVSLYGILQYLFGWGYQSSAWVDSNMFTSISFRATSTLENPNMLGQYLVLMIPLGGARLLSAKTWPSRLLCFLCCGLMCVCMLLTLSRGAWLGLFVAGAVFFVMLNARLVLLALPAAAGLLLVLPATIFARLTSIGNMSDSSTSYRVSIWKGSLSMLKDYWLCGVGPGAAAFKTAYRFYSYDGANAEHAHNLFLQLVCNAGVVALVVFLAAVLVYLRAMGCAVSRERDGTSRLHQIAFTAGVLGFLAQGMTDFSFYNYRVLFLFWTYLALGACCAGRSRLPEGGRTP